MPAKDKFHQIVKTAIQKDGWTITHDPYPLQAGSFDLAIDLGAEEIVAATKQERTIAIEIKSFLGASKISEFYGALGQFITYRTALIVQEPERVLYLAVPSDVYEKFFLTTFIQNLMKQNQLNLIIYDIEQEIIEQWIP
ncbi:MAG: element excision factor XisH family protein [Waterburya sp.]